MNPTVDLYLDTRRMKSNKRYPVKVRVYFNRNYRHFYTNHDLTMAEFKGLSNPRITPKLKDKKKEFDKMLRLVDEFIKEIEPFSLEKLDERWESYQKKTKQHGKGLVSMRADNIYNHIEQVVEELMRAGRISTANTFQQTAKKLRDYHKKLYLPFSEVTPAFLEGMENWMVDTLGHSVTTVGINARNIRTLFNRAIELEIVDVKLYPFGRRKYVIPSARNIKKALGLDELRSIFGYQPDSDAERRSMDFWKFSYLANGMNVKDILLLRNRNYVAGDKTITFVRAKTKRSKKSDLKPIVVHVGQELSGIIETWRNKDKAPEAFLFPIMVPSASAKKQREVVQNFTRVINVQMKKIGVKLGVKIPLTTYTARHSFSTVLMRSGANLKYISDALGHSSLKTTESYLGSFDSGTREFLSNKLTDFGSSEAGE